MSHSLFHSSQPFDLEFGGCLSQISLAYTTLGSYNAAKNNVVWVCHALTANADPSDWWAGLVGKGKLYDPENQYIICANILGSCYGSTGPTSQNPDTLQPYFHDFARLSTRDIARSFDLLATHLGISHIHTLIGGSLGGQCAMEWAIAKPDLFSNLILLATNAQHSPWGKAFNESQRMAIMADATWPQKNINAGQNGLKAARAMALLSYRHYEAYKQTQSDAPDSVSDYKAVSYQRHQGQKLVARFDAFSYVALTHLMDAHSVGRGRLGGHIGALSIICAHTLVIGISSDLLFPISEQQFLANHIANGSFKQINSDFGHDGFLVDTDKITGLIDDFYNQNLIENSSIKSRDNAN